jgi:hypothetical protein
MRGAIAVFFALVIGGDTIPLTDHYTHLERNV